MKIYSKSSAWQVFAYSLISCSIVCANPSDPVVVNGSATFENIDSRTLSITTSDQAVIQWRDFSIAEHELAQFVQPTAQSVVVNKVTSELSSVLMGSLKANGKVFLLNPNGVLIGEKGSIDTNGFIASTLSASFEDLLDGSREVLFQGSSTASIVNLGTVTAWDGDVFLISYQIANEGSVNAPGGTAAMAAGQEVLLRPQALEKIVIRPSLAKYENATTGLDNSGVISACKAELKADGNAYAMAIRHTGAIDALGVAEHNGEVFLVAEGGNNGVYGSIIAKNSGGTGGSIQILGDHVAVLENAKIDASGKIGGGTVLIGGDKSGKNTAVLNAKTTYVDKNTVITADAVSDGNGGKVILWADETTCFYGNISTRGGENSGDGGFVEVSGLHSLDFRGVADRLAPQGNAGMLLLDPLDIDISAALNNAVTGGTPFTPTGAGSNLNNGTLIAALIGGNVIVQSAAGGASFGSITVSPTSSPADQISYNSANSLTLDNTAASSAGSTITINPTVLGSPTIVNAGTGNIIINAGYNIDVNAGISTGGNVTLSTTTGNGGQLNIIASAEVADINCAAFTANIDGGISMMGGAVAGFEAVINTSAGPAAITCNSGNIVIVGGANPTTNAGITCVGLTLNAPNCNLIMNGGAIGSPQITSIFSPININILNLNMAGAAPTLPLIDGINAAITINAGQAVNLSGDSLIIINTFIAGTHAMLIKAGTNIALNSPTCAMFNLQGPITLVVDNAPPFNVSPNIGPGRFINNGLVMSKTGDLRIFTAVRSQNIQAGVLNGGLFVPGPYAINTPTEHWSIWYPNAFVGPNYTVFYKEPYPPFVIPPTATAVTLFNQAAYEFLQDLKDYDVFWYWKTLFTSDYDHEKYDQEEQWNTLESSNVIGRSIYKLLRKSYREQNGKVTSLFRQ